MKEQFHLESQSIQGVARSVDASGVPKIWLQFDMRAQPEYGSDVRSCIGSTLAGSLL